MSELAAGVRSAAPAPSIVLRPRTGWVGVDVRELWAYRELLYFLVWRNLKVRYKQTALGAGWAVIQPFFTMVVFSLFFGRLAGMPSDGLPYPIFAYAGLVPWTYFAGALTQGSNSLVDHERMITKVYFPRLLLPLSGVVSGLVDLVIALTVLFALMAFYGIAPTGAVLALPFFVVLAAVTAFSVSLWLSALNVRYRDVRHAIGFLVQVWLFATPIAYPVSIVPAEWRTPYALNPMVGVVQGFRWALLGEAAPSPAMLVASALSVTVLLIGGLAYFRRLEREFADVI